MDTRISKIPDVLIIHLKRFAFLSGYLEKIEDLVTFPLQNLDISKYLAKFLSSTPKSSYDLYGTVSHYMLQTSGGHYSAAV